MADRHDVLTFTFPGREAAAAAYEEVKRLHGVHQAALVERDDEGVLQLTESWVHSAGAPTVGAGIAGGLIGLVGGPLGALIGWIAGTMVGGVAEDASYRHAAQALTVLSVDLPEHAHSVLAEAREKDPAAADALAGRFGGTLTRRPAEEVEAGVAEAEKAAETTAETTAETAGETAGETAAETDT